MAPVTIKYVVSFSSQDDYHRIQNLLSGDGFKKWLSNSKEKSGQIDAIFQLEEPCQLAYIDIGSHWCASVEIKVGRSDWPQNRLYQTLVATSMLMTPVESKMGKGIVKTRMFNSDNFAPAVAAEKWDRIQVILRQPYRKDVQYGLSFIRLKTAGVKPGDITEGRKIYDVSSNHSGSSTPKSVTSIQKHFFGNKTESSNMSPDPVKSRLMKIAGSAENGSEHGAVLSRTAKLVLSASENIGKYSPQARAGPSKSSRTALFSEHLAQKYGSSFEEELDEFLSTLTLSEVDLDEVTIADLRHRFEKRKLRKLTGDEKKVFMEKCGDCICRLFENVEKGQDAMTYEVSSLGQKKSPENLRQTPKSCKRKLDIQRENVKTPKSSHMEDKPSLSKEANKKSVKKKTKSTFEGPTDKYEKSTLVPQRAFISQVQKAFGSSDIERRVPFSSKSTNNSDNPSSKSSRKNSNSFSKDSTSERSETCGMWLSKETDLEVGETVDVTPKSGGRQKTPRSLRGRGRRKRGGKADTSSERIPVVDDDATTSRFGNYVYCSSCKGNVPEHIFSDHFIRCGGESSSVQNGISSQRSTLLSAHTSPVSNTDNIHSAINISSDSDLAVNEDNFDLVECPLCGEFYSSDVIMVHADVCATAMEMSGL